MQGCYTSISSFISFQQFDTCSCQNTFALKEVDWAYNKRFAIWSLNHAVVQYTDCYGLLVEVKVEHSACYEH